MGLRKIPRSSSSSQGSSTLRGASAQGTMQIDYSFSGVSFCLDSGSEDGPNLSNSDLISSFSGVRAVAIAQRRALFLEFLFWSRTSDIVIRRRATLKSPDMNTKRRAPSCVQQLAHSLACDSTFWQGLRNPAAQ